MPSVYGCCSGQTAASIPVPSASLVTWVSSSLGESARWGAGDSNYNNPIFSYNSLLTAEITDQALNVVIDFNGGSGYTAGNTITSFLIRFSTREGSPNTPQFQGNVTGNTSTIDLAGLGTTMTIPTLSSGAATFDILPLIIANGPDSTNTIGWTDSDRTGTFKTTITFRCLDDTGEEKGFTLDIGESSEFPQVGPTVIPPSMTVTISTTQGGVSSVGTNSPLSGNTLFTPAIPMTHSGGAPIDDYIITVALAFDDLTYPYSTYSGDINSLSEFVLEVTPIGGPNFEWNPELSDPTQLVVSDYNPNVPLANPPSTTSYNLNTFIGTAIGGLPPPGLIVLPDPETANTFVLSIRTSDIKDIYNRPTDVRADIPISNLITS